MLQARLQQQLNKNNKGSSLVTVLLVASIIAALVTVVLAIVLLNVYMKKADLEGQGVFYDAESALEEIRAGLSKDESDATTTAYLDTLSNYANLEDEKKTINFDDKFSEIIKNKLTDTSSGLYKISTLEGYLRETKMKDGVGAEILTNPAEAHFNITKEGAVLKDVHVRYTDKNNYVSEIKTDIVLEYPPVNFQNASSIDNILTYGLIADKAFDPSGSVEVIGNAYLGSELGKDGDNKINSANVDFYANGTQETNVISGGNFLLDGSTVNTNNIAFWSDKITLDKSEFNMNTGSLYIKDDLVLGNNAKSKLAGKLIMFGNPWVAADLEADKNPDKAKIQSSEVREAARDDMPSYSSSIIVTGSNAGLDMSGLNTMVIGGSAYVDTESQNKNLPTGKKNNVNIVTGQSMALKSDQRAYLVPPTLVGVNEIEKNGVVVGYENYQNGLTNPMTANQFKALQQEIADKNYGGDVSRVQPTDYVSMNLAEPTLGVSLNAFVMAHNPTKTQDWWEENGYLPSVRACAYPTTSGGGSIVYLFIEFKTVGDNYTGQQNADYIPAEAFYNNWYKLYNSTATNYQRLLGNIDYYATYGIKLPKDVNDKTRMYFTGNILSNELFPVIVPDIITQPDFTIDLNVEYSKQSAYYQDAFFTLNKNLSTRYVTLTGDEKQNTLFNNLITESVKVGDKTYNLSGTKYYVSPTGEGAVVHKGDVTYNNSLENSLRNETDVNGDKHNDAKVNVIIATGDVTVNDNFEGMIIAGGKVNVKSKVKVTSDSDKAAKALQARKEDDVNDTAANFVINAAKYLLGGTGTVDGDSGEITMKDYVTFRNWTKQ